MTDPATRAAVDNCADGLRAALSELRVVRELAEQMGVPSRVSVRMRRVHEKIDSALGQLTATFSD